jgi:hypothetical protein
MPIPLLLGLLQIVLQYAPGAVEAVSSALAPHAPDLTDEHQVTIQALIAQGKAEAALRAAQA